MRYKILVLSFILTISNISFAQVSNEHLESDIYGFLNKMSSKGVIVFNNLVTPVSQKIIAQKLVEINESSGALTQLERDQLVYFFEEYGYEIQKIRIQNSEFRRKKIKSGDGRLETGEGKVRFGEEELGERNNLEGEMEKEKSGDWREGERERVDSLGNEKRDLFDKSWEFEVRRPADDIVQIDEKKSMIFSNNNKINLHNSKTTIFKKDEFNRFRFFSYYNQNGYLKIRPVIGYEYGMWEKDNYQNLELGLRLAGQFGDILGFNFDLRQIRQAPRISNFLYNSFSPDTKIKVQLADAERLEYSLLNADIGIDWEWGSFSFGKNQINWGYAENGKIVLSSRAPSFPYIRLDLYPTDWFRFNYIHGWLNSEVLDTNSSYSSWRVRDWSETDRNKYVQKFIALHSVTFTPIKGLDLSMGESVVYADHIQIPYLVPLMFFDLADEFLSVDDNYAGSSTQLFLAASSKGHIPNTHLYASFHADELTPEGLFDPATQYYKFAFTFGSSVYDLPIKNMDLTLEYTKVYPGNYRHFMPTLTYESSSTLLGHWMGDNADLLYFSLNYSFYRNLKIKVWTQIIRKGTEALGNRAYKIQIPQPGFLFTDNITDRKNYFYYGFEAEYEFKHDFWIKLNYQYIDYEQRVTEDSFNSNIYRDFSFMMGYGI